MRNVLICTCGVILMATASMAQQTNTAATDPLSGNAAFAKHVTVTCPGLAVGELLNILSSKTGVKLLADKSIADDKVIIFTPSRPLKDTLKDLAALFCDDWRHTQTKGGEDRYVLYRTGRAVEYERILSKETAARLITKVDEQVKALSETPEQLAKRPESDLIRKALADPGNRVATAVYAGLSQDQKTTLFEQRVMNFPASQIGQQLAEPVGALYKQCAARAASFRGRESSTSGETAREYAHNGIQFALHNCGGKLTASIYAYGKSSMIGFLFADVATADTWALGPHGNPYSPGPLPRAAVLPSAEFVQKAQAEANWIDRLQKLANSSGAAVMADLYRSGAVNFVPTDAAQPAADQRERPEVTALDRLCWQKGYTWWPRSNGALLFRKRDWFEQQRYEVPDRWLAETVSRMKAQDHIPKVRDLLRAREVNARQILGLNGMGAGDGFSYSEFETLGSPELVEFLNRELTSRSVSADQSSVVERPLEPGRVFEKAYFNENISSLASDDAFMSFLNSQAAPIPAGDVRFFQADVYSENRGSGPGGGWKDASVVVDWKVGPLMDKRMTISLPFEIPFDRRDQVKIEVE